MGDLTTPELQENIAIRRHHLTPPSCVCRAPLQTPTEKWLHFQDWRHSKELSHLEYPGKVSSSWLWSLHLGKVFFYSRTFQRLNFCFQINLRCKVARSADGNAAQGRARHRSPGGRRFPWFPKAGNGHTKSRQQSSSFQTASQLSFFKSSFYLEIIVDSHMLVGNNAEILWV